MQHYPECGWTTHVPLHVLYDELQVITNGFTHQLIYVLADTEHYMVLPHGLIEGSDGRDFVHSHYEI